MMLSAWTLNLSFFKKNEPLIPNLPEALEQGQLDTSSGTRKIRLGDGLHSIESVVGQIDSLHGQYPKYIQAAREYHRIVNTQQGGLEQSCCTVFANLFSCFRCTTACKEQEILQYGAIPEEGVDSLGQATMILSQELGIENGSNNGG